MKTGPLGTTGVVALLVSAFAVVACSSSSGGTGPGTTSASERIADTCASDLASGQWPEDQYVEAPAWPQSYAAYDSAGQVDCTPTTTEDHCRPERQASVGTVCPSRANGGGCPSGCEKVTMNHASCALRCGVGDACASELASGAWPEDQTAQAPAWPQSYSVFDGAGWVDCTPGGSEHRCTRAPTAPPGTSCSPPSFTGACAAGCEEVTLNHAICTLRCGGAQGAP